MLITDKVVSLIEEMLDSQNGIAEIRRNEFAFNVGCAPSQINYVITSRFNKERGYIVESRRGGGGYIRIIRPRHNGNTYLYHLLSAIGDRIDAESASFLAKDMLTIGVITEREAAIISSVLASKGLFGETKDRVDYGRADVFKEIILNIINFS